MAFPSTPILDTANRANENPLSDGGKWSSLTSLGLSNLQIVSNQIVGTSAALANDAMYWNPLTLTDCEVYGTIATLLSNATTDSLFLIARFNSASINGYTVVYDGASTILAGIITGGAFTQKASYTQTVSLNDSFGMVIIGSTITSWYRVGNGQWFALGSFTDTTYTSGNLAINMTYTTTSPGLINFGGGQPQRGQLTTNTGYWGGI